MSFWSHAAAFVVGAGLGAGITYVVVKKKCDEKANEDIARLDDYYKSKETEKAEKKEEPKEEKKGKQHYAEVEIPKQPAEASTSAVTPPRSAVPERDGIFVASSVKTSENGVRTDYTRLVRTYTEEKEPERNALTGEVRFEYLTREKFDELSERAASDTLELYETGECVDVFGNYHELTEECGRDAWDNFGKYGEPNVLLCFDNQDGFLWEVIKRKGCPDGPFPDDEDPDLADEDD